MSLAAVTPAAAQIARWTTPQILRTSRVVLLGLDALLLVAVLVGTSVHRGAMQLVGKDTAPSIIAAQHIKAALADMDADLANELLAPASAGQDATGPYDQRRVEAAKALIVAAKNITYGESEEKPIQDLQVMSGTYERLAQQARDFAGAGQTAKATTAYREAAKVMDGSILPAADRLDKANNDVLEREYERMSRESLMTRVLIGLLGLLALAGLAATQVFLSRRTHRVLNPGLLVATLATVWPAAYSFSVMTGESHDLKVARQDAFTSLHALWQARSVGYAVNASESRYLLDPAHAGEYEASFFAGANAMAHLPPTASVDQVLAGAQGVPVAGFTGYLADELNNITFAGERPAAVEALTAFERYMAIDGEIRRLERAGDHKGAIRLCIGSSPGESDWAFEQFDRALLATLEINQQAFDRAVTDGFDTLHGMEIKTAIAAALIAVLILVGLAPRIREYA